MMSVLVGVVLSGVVYVLMLLIEGSIQQDEGFISVYECGFDVGVYARRQFSYRFFLLAILFIVFDVEISLMLPVPYVIYDWWLFLFFGLFLLILLLGTLYEMWWGSLEWLN